LSASLPLSLLGGACAQLIKYNLVAVLCTRETSVETLSCGLHCE